MHRISSRALRLAVGAALSGVLALPSTALALDTFFVGPRAMGMAGANVASATDTTAQYYNPAAFGFFGMVGSETDKKGKTVEKRLTSDNNNVGRKDWGWDVVYAGAGYSAHKDLGDIINDFSDVNLDKLESSGIQSEDDLRAVVNLAKDLNLLEEEGNGLTVNVLGGTAFRVGSFALGVRGYGQGAAWVSNVDTDLIGLDVDIGDLNTQIASYAPAGAAGHSVSLLTTAQQNQLAAAGLDPNAIAVIDYMAIQEGLTQEDIAPFADTMESIALTSQSGANNGDLSANKTTVAVTGFGLTEVPFSYGYAFNEHFAIGGNLKFMAGRVYGTQVLIFNNDTDEIMEKTQEDYKQTITFGVDLGAMARFRWVQLGVVGRNLNSPKFKGPEVTNVNGGVTKFQDVKVKPQAQAGIAFIPFETLTFEVDYDLTKNETLLGGYETQYLRAGVEWDVFRFLALRGGVYTNMAEDDIGLVYTAGVGLNLWAVRFDVSGAVSSKTMEYDGEEYPREAHVVAGLSIDF
ncbi:MAG: conjugal transfer protein TraF [Desulfocurvibacter africanus]